MAVSLDLETREKVEEIVEEIDHFLDAAVNGLLLGDRNEAVAMIEQAVAARHSAMAAFPQPLADCYQTFRDCELLASVASRWPTDSSHSNALPQEVIDDLQRALAEVQSLPDRYPENVARPLVEALAWLREMIKALQTTDYPESLSPKSPERFKKMFLQNVAPEEPLEEYFGRLDLVDAGLVNALLELEKSPPEFDEAIEHLELARQHKQLFLQSLRDHAKSGHLPSHERAAIFPPTIETD